MLRAARIEHRECHAERASPRLVSFDAGEAGRLSGLVDAPDEPRAAFVLAHGAGAGMAHAFMASPAAGLAARGTATLHFVERLGARVSLRLFEDADHAIHVRARSESNDAAVMAALLDALAAWTAA